MEFKTIVARKEGVCKRCGQPVNVGERIRWAAGRGSYHLASECVASQPGEVIATEPGARLVCANSVQPVREVDRQVLTQAVKLPDADAMLAAFGVK